MTSQTIVRVTRPVDAVPEQVFDAWIDPELLRTWMFGRPEVGDEEIVHLEVDPRVGGKFSFLVRRQGREIDHVGEYLEIDRPRRLVFTWGVVENLPDTSRVTVDIVPRGAGSEVTLTHELDPKWSAYARRTENGWTTMIEALGERLARARTR